MDKEKAILKKEDCSRCKDRREADDNFCSYCGKQLKENPVILDYKSLEK